MKLNRRKELREVNEVRQFLVTLEMPTGTTVREMERYVETAVASHCGCMDPDDAIYYLDKSKVRAMVIPKPRVELN